MPVAAAVVGDGHIAARRVLAARNMAAERRRAAALDRCHHLQLVAAHVTGIGLAPCRSVIAEDIRNLQCRTGQDRRPLCRWLVRLILPALLGLLVLLRQQVERALDRRAHAAPSSPVWSVPATLAGYEDGCRARAGGWQSCAAARAGSRPS